MSLVFLIYLMLLFEGAVRKWMLPQMSDVLYFMRDPLVLAVYCVAVANKLFRVNWLSGAFIGLGLVCIPLMVAQVVSGSSPLILAYGWHNYFFNVPLAFIIGQTFRTADLRRLFRVTLLLAIPMAVLVYFQFTSRPDAFINKNILAETFVFRVAGDIVRTSGTFSFTAGQSLFVGSLVGIVAINWLMPPRKRVLPSFLMMASTAAALTMVALSGSRTVFFLLALTLCATTIAGLLTGSRGTTAKAILVSIFVLTAGGVIMTLVFPTAFEAMTERQTTAVEQEGSTIGRALSSLTLFVSFIPQAPAEGFGLGYGTGAGSTLATGTASFTLAEDEWSRNVLEGGPLVGLAYIVLRIALVLSLGLGAIRAARFRNNPVPAVLFGFVGIVLLTGQITLQGTINGYGWIFAGICIAAMRSQEFEQPFLAPTPSRQAFAGLATLERPTCPD